MDKTYHETENMQEDSKQDVSIAVAQNDIEHIKRLLSDIKEQTVKTNGRVTDLEKQAVRYDTGLTLIKWAIGAGLINIGAFATQLIR